MNSNNIKSDNANSTIVDLIINLLHINMLKTIDKINRNYSTSNQFVCLNIADFISIPSTNFNTSLISLNFRLAIISNENIKNSQFQCANYFSLNSPTKVPNTKFANQSSSITTGLTMKQVVMICICTLILGGVALAAAALRLRYYCKRRKTQCKDESYGYPFGSRCSFSEIGIENGRRLNISRSLNYPTLEIYPNTFYQTVQSMDTPQLQHTVAAIHTHYVDLNLNKPLYSVAIKNSPVLEKIRQSVTDIHKLNRACIPSANKKQRRHSLTNKIDAVMIKHFQKTGITPHRKQRGIHTNRSESIDVIKSINSKNVNSKRKTKSPLKTTRSCSERLNWLVK